jgi:translation elongation factor EF-1beta
LESVKKAIEKIAKVKQIKEEELGFGIKFLRATLLLADSDGGMDQLEEKMMKIPNVSQVEVETVTRV